MPFSGFISKEPVCMFTLVSNLFFTQSDSHIFFKFEFLFHEDTQYTGVWKYCAVCLKIDYTLRCLEYICSVYSPLGRYGLLIVKTQMYSNYYIFITIDTYPCFQVNVPELYKRVVAMSNGIKSVTRPDDWH